MSKCPVCHGRAEVLLLSRAHWIQRRVRELNEGVSSEVEPGPFISNFNTYIYGLAHTTKLVRLATLTHVVTSGGLMLDRRLIGSDILFG